ncbi:hypothetical protein PMSV_4178 [Photobacterium leiognathi subsp. mandapamensis svers.1.1.]|nr:hypothetical protein PMSV_4178 [Photobacterium leiognathi subsp. mandapamensis svers.1.1.]
MAPEIVIIPKIPIGFFSNAKLKKYPKAINTKHIIAIMNIELNNDKKKFSVVDDSVFFEVIIGNILIVFT